jgi:2-C-methyl-D-erythritol 2,4-cyclodiphosphate synthase
VSRVGLGFDSHPLVAGRRLMLGGIEVPFERGLAGHSDGDALLHAVADAVLSAAGLGSIGEIFSDKDPAFRDADSLALLREAAARIAEAGFRVTHVDGVVLAEAPRIAPLRGAMAERIAAALSVEPARVTVRGTSTNGLGFVGRGEGIAAMAVALLEEPGRST